MPPTRNLTKAQRIAAARQAHSRGDHHLAATLFGELLQRDRSNVELLFGTGVSLLHLQRYAEARPLLSRAVEGTRKAPGNWIYYLAMSYRGEGRFSDARDMIERGLREHPDDQSLLCGRAEIAIMSKDFDTASAALERVLSVAPEHLSASVMLAKVHQRQGDPAAALALLEPLIEKTPNGPKAQRLLYGAGDACDRLGQFDRAFEYYARANMSIPTRFNAEAHRDAVDLCIERWDADFIKSLPKVNVDASRVVLIVGMRRSGTSLVEQILSTHTQVHGAGELSHLGTIAVELEGPPGNVAGSLTNVSRLNKSNLERSGRRYLNELRRLSPGASHVTDKMPSNFMWLGLVSAMLPGARVIHCQRDPLDTCLSAYVQSFVDNTYCSDLRLLGSYYRDYQRLMAHWTTHLDLNLIEVSYEELTAQQERESRRMIDWLGLDWEDACLRYYESDRVTRTASNDQVIQPIYTSSVGRHRNYDKHLGPLREALAGPLGVE